MFDDQGSNQNDNNQMSGVDEAASSGYGTGEISSPSQDERVDDGASEPTLVHPTTPPPQDDNGASDDNSQQGGNDDAGQDNDVPSLGGNSFSDTGSSASEDSSDNQSGGDDAVSESTETADNSSSNDNLNDNTPAPSAPPAGDLADIRRQALDQLSPIVHQLDQSPEDKYKTLMMMIQASDNQELIKEAYQTAQKITDEKAKAEALLNIVNEINYFTQNNNQ